MTKRPAPEYPSKSELVRQYLRDHPDAMIDEIVAGLKAQGILVSNALAAYAKYDRFSKELRAAGTTKIAAPAPGKPAAGDKSAAIRAAIDKQGQRFRPRDVIAALAADGVKVSLAEVIAVAKSLGLRPRKRS